MGITPELSQVHSAASNGPVDSRTNAIANTKRFIGSPCVRVAIVLHKGGEGRLGVRRRSRRFAIAPRAAHAHLTHERVTRVNSAPSSLVAPPRPSRHIRPDSAAGDIRGHRQGNVIRRCRFGEPTAHSPAAVTSDEMCIPSSQDSEEKPHLRSSLSQVHASTDLPSAFPFLLTESIQQCGCDRRYNLRTMKLTQERRERIAAISRQHGARSVRLFGSYARGEAAEGSDLDLLVEMQQGRSLLDLIDLQHALESELGIDVDVLTPKSLSPYLRESVEKDAVFL